jgi:hypothetical protein
MKGEQGRDSLAPQTSENQKGWATSKLAERDAVVPE